MDLRSSERWSYRCFPTPTATFPAIIYSEEEDSNGEVQRTRDGHTEQSIWKNEIELLIETLSRDGFQFAAILQV
mgnify:CR=1 FL=1